MSNKFIYGLAIFLISILMATSITANPLPEVVTTMIAEAKSQIKVVDMAAFKKVVDAKQYTYIIDVREPAEYNAGHIPGAINIPRGVIEFRIWALVGHPEKIDMNAKLYLYCKTGGRCALATKTLKDFGFREVTAVDMRFSDWQDAGYPVEVVEAEF